MRVLVTWEIHQESLDILKKRFKVDYKPGISKKELVSIVKSYDVLVIRTYTPVDKIVLDAGKRLKYIVSCSVGLDNIDIDECDKKGISVINAPGSNANAVAEHTVLLMLSSLRNISLATKKINKGDWNKKELIGKEIQKKIIGLFGFGKIGRLVAEKLSGFGVKLIAYDPYPPQIDVFKGLNVEKVDKEGIISKSDIISVHVPLTKETRYMFNSEMFSKMKKGVIIINTSRGGVINEKDLEKSLVSGKIYSIGLDVFENEPLQKESFLLKNKKSNITPHIAALTQESFRNMCVMSVNNFLERVDIKLS